MRILIDLQACQSSGSRTRGIGRYSFSLAQAMLKNSAAHDIHLLLNSAFPDAVLDLRTRLGDLLPQENIHVWQGVLPASELSPQNQWRLRASESIREQAIHALHPDVVHVSSLFEGLVDDAVTSVGNSGSCLSAVTLYDLIPLINANPYLENPSVRAWYYRKVQALKRADLLLAISESSRREGLDYLHLPEEKIVNISSAIDDRFAQMSLTTTQLQELSADFGLIRQFIMYTGGIDLRKNIEGLIAAYANLPAAIRRDYQLAIVCSITQHDRERLQHLVRSLGLADVDVVMTGFVSDEDLPKLYNACALFVFPSWHEGFGLPALEAMACGAPVIAANTSSLPEVIGREDALFDPYNRDAICGKMVEVLSNPEFRRSLIEHGLVQAKKFSWNASAKAAMNAFETAYPKRNLERTSLGFLSGALSKPKLAYFSPLPPAQSGIADYSAELLPELARHYDIEIIAEQSETNDAWLSANFPVRTMDWFEAHSSAFSRVVYNFGNSTFHDYMLDAMAKFPGIVVLHDFYHSGLMAHLDLTGQRSGIWEEALYRSHGYSAIYAKKKAQDLNQIIWTYPCNQLVLERAQGVIVHSEFSKKLAQKWYGAHAADNWKLIQHLRILPKHLDRKKARASLGLNESDFLICSFGILGPTKLNHALLSAWLNSSLANNSHCHLVFVGKNDGGDYGAELMKTIKSSKAAARIKITGFADLELFRSYLQAADVAVQLRTLSRGETSGTVLDCMAYGIPTIINSNGSMAELPAEALIKLAEDVQESQLTEQIEALYANQASRTRLALSARAHIQKHHNPYQIGDDYYHAIEANYARSSKARLHLTMGEIASIDAPFSDEDLQAASVALSSNERYDHARRLLVYCNDIETVVPVDCLQSLMSSILEHEPSGWRVEPVVFDAPVLRLAAQRFEGMLGIQSDLIAQLETEVVDLRASDVFLYVESAQGCQQVEDNLEAYLKLHGIPLIKMAVGEQTKGGNAPSLASAKEMWQAVAG